MGRYLPWFNILGIITRHSTLFDQGIHCVMRAGVSTSQEFLGILSFCNRLVKWFKNFRKGASICISTYAIRNHQHWHPWWQARPIQRPREQSSCWTSSWLDKQLCSLGDRNQSHTKPSDSGLYILFHAVGEVNFCHNDASNEEFLLLIFVLKSICGEWFVLYLLLKQKMPYPPARIEKSTTPFWMNTYHDYYSSKEQVWKYKKVYALL